MTEEQIAALRAPFPSEEVQWRAGATNRDNTKALALAYIDARAVMDRLDEVLGPMNWTDSYEEWKDGAVKAGIALRDGDAWIWKYDGADETTFEATKGGFSDAFKRAAVKWGIGRYLYQLPGVWVNCEKAGNTVRLSETPKLPSWALPGESKPGHEEQEVSRPQPALWWADSKERAGFWAWCRERGLSHDEVHTALGVSSLKEWTKMRIEAEDQIDGWITDRIEAARAQAEAEEIEEAL